MRAGTPRWRPLSLAVSAVVLAVLGATLAAGLRPSTPDSATGGPPTRVRGEPAPALTGTTLAGGRFDLGDLRGKVVVVNVWASWCDPCRQELPLMAAAERRWGGQGLAVVGINLRDGAESARRTLAELGVRDLLSVADPRGTAAVTWGVVGVPETFVVDRAGQLRLSVRGAVDAAWLERRLPPLLVA
ncbi:TlpA family protein disulfide reductase [Phytohabitans kaempferiae]|uniref:TlpA family protein disulfide reductase n=1 Tax=Phytohabitans kaempferiae TaxID=1620943 RepID=A0ABV6MAF3_9ACTN